MSTAAATRPARLFGARPYLSFPSRTGRRSWLVNEYFYDLDHWAKYANHPFNTERQALRFIAAKQAAGEVLDGLN